MEKTLKLLNTSEKGIFKNEYYEISDYGVSVDYENGKIHNIFIINDKAIKSNKSKIFYDNGSKLIGPNGKKCFRISTHSFGVLNVEEIEEIIKYYQEAIEVVKVLTEKFIK